MTEIQQLMALFTFLVGLLAGLQIYLHREIRRDVRDVRRDVRDVRRELRDVRGELRETQTDVKILINDVGEVKGAVGLATTGRGRESVGLGD